MFVTMSEPEQKCGNNAISDQNCTFKLMFLSKLPILAVSAQGESRFPPKKFYNIDYCWSIIFYTFRVVVQTII